MVIPPPARPREIPAHPARGELLHFLRSHAPDLRIRKKLLEDGRRACRGDFTFHGEELVVEAVEAEGLDPDDAVVRRCALLLYRRLGVLMPIDARQGDALERQILTATANGNTELADRLGLELVLFNEGRRRPAAAQQPAVIRSRLEPR